MATHRAAVLGSPIGHSLSPVLHRAAYAHLQLHGWDYDAHEVDERTLEPFLASLGDVDGRWVGLSLTMPLKRAVMPLLDVRSATVDLTDVANTVVLAGGQLSGHNTDVAGLVNALRGRGVEQVAAPLVLGGGATAASALAAVARLGATAVLLCVRRPDAAAPLRRLADRLGLALQVVEWDTPTALRAVAGSDLVVATSPAGSTDDLARALPDHAGATLFDVIYAPWPTALAAAWQRGGGEVVGGLDLLVHQAALQVALMVDPVVGDGVVRPAELVGPMREAALGAVPGLKTQAGPAD